MHFGHPWCALAMELLDEHVDYLGHVRFSSAVYRVREPIPPAALPVEPLERLSADEALGLVDRFAERVGEPDAGHVRLCGAMVLIAYGEFERARERMRDVAESYDDSATPHISHGFEHLPPLIAEGQARAGAAPR